VQSSAALFAAVSAGMYLSTLHRSVDRCHFPSAQMGS
jgi:hypothetical protein